MAFLIGMSGTVKGQKFNLDKDRITIGRAANNDIVVQDEAASSQHCYISRRGDRYLLHDLNSTNGTMLNMQPITGEAELQSKTVIQVGSSEIMFDDGTPQGTAAAVQSATEVVVEKSPAVQVPNTFTSISPFGARYKSNKGLWLTVVIVFALIALAGLALFCYLLIKAV
jgi:pSer/pThr/pTyr-binding forkhead associated (FHA) protein